MEIVSLVNLEKSCSIKSSPIFTFTNTLFACISDDLTTLVVAIKENFTLINWPIEYKVLAIHYSDCNQVLYIAALQGIIKISYESIIGIVSNIGLQKISAPH